ncbi:ABC transporter, ATPbinding domain containing protein [Acanthamoeba castellanii str. Neff]|uniref:ABC transporter, ATPbinding domain containing protein n=1 Tax=Acanthamoeba castellanii (strain ATCC 30010 / Neff) TaxID=1257118 RepID=L8GUW4_ACACF|nr:ABC transporter, ATPbinding domain containing protein [Acanthamoeba castellanii str. Neff]ELR15891.1 ABC transporter, ATPbinding domain containing protein [Acanthamoeba castellanii str. Neff]
METETEEDIEILTEYSFVKHCQEVWSHCVGYHRQVVKYLLLSVVVAFFGMAPPYLISWYINKLTKADYEGLNPLVASAVASYLAFHISDAFVVYQTSVLAENIACQVRLTAWNELLKHGANAVDSFIRFLFRVGVVKDFLSTVFSFGFIFYMDWRIGLVTLFTSIFYVIHFIYIKNRIVVYRNTYLEKTEATTGSVWGYFAHILVLKLLNMMDQILPTLDAYVREALAVRRNILFLDRYKVTVGRVCNNVSEMLILVLMTGSLIAGNTVLGDVLLMHKYYAKFNSHLRAMTNNYDIYLKTCTKMYRFSRLMTECRALKQAEPELPSRVPSNWTQIEFSKVCFSYESLITKARPALDHVAIVGRSGSGKSTLVKILLRLYHPQSGEVTVGGTNIANVVSEELYNCIKVVPQDDELLNCSLFQNLAYATPDPVSEDDVIDALRKADAWHFIQDLPNRLGSVIGPGGVQLSGGETQRVCIARALISSPQVIVLDEATSSLDVMTEQRVHATMASLSQDTTIIAVTHRISSLHLFDRILVMHHGKLVGDGTHEQLLGENEYYQGLQKANSEDQPRQEEHPHQS